MNVEQRKTAIKQYLLQERLVDNEALGRTKPLSRTPKLGYSTHWITSAYEELNRILTGVTPSNCEPMLVGFNDYQKDRYLSDVSKEDLDRFVGAMAESSYSLTPTVEKLVSLAPN